MPASLRQEMLLTLRRRICGHVSSDTLVLHEGRIAEEFGVSRTPVRDVMTLLSAHKMVETRPGVGTIPAPLDPDRRWADVSAYVALCVAASTSVAGERVDQETQLEMLSCIARRDLVSKPDLQTFINVASCSALILFKLVSDPILREALEATYWRFLRWRARDVSENLSEGWRSTVSALDDLNAALKWGDSAETLQVAADMASRYSRVDVSVHTAVS